MNKNKNVNVVEVLLKTFVEKETKNEKTERDTLIQEWKTTSAKELSHQSKFISVDTFLRSQVIPI